MIQVCDLNFANSSITDTLGNYSFVSSGNVTINGVTYPANTDPILYGTDSSYNYVEFGQTATYSNGAIIQAGIPDYGSENWSVEFRARVTSAIDPDHGSYEIFYGFRAPYDNNGTIRKCGYWSIAINSSFDALEFFFVDYYDSLTIKDNLDFTSWHLYKVTKTAEEILTLHIDGVLVATIDLEQQIGYKTHATLGSFVLLGDADEFPTENRIQTNQVVRLADVKVYADPMGHAEKAISLDNLSRVFRNYNTWLGSQLSGKANSSHTHTKSDITDFPSLATVATSGSYNDLSNKPTIPTTTSELTNDSGFLTSHQDLSDYVPRSGGAVMTGSLLASPTTTNSIGFGYGWGNGGTIYTYSSTESTVGWQGAIRLEPLKATDNFKTMQLFPSGTWTWNGTAVQITSDQRYKQQIAKIDDKLLDAWEDVELSQFKYNDAVEQKGKDKARLHTGYVVQQIETACKSHNVDISEYGLFCHEEYAEETEEAEVEQKDGTKSKERKVIHEADEHYSLRYTEALVVECAYLRKRIKELEERLEKLEGNSK